MARPRSLTEQETLSRALILFWEKGYDRTSIADLSTAVGVGPSSLYNSYGNKAGLFRNVLHYYVETYAGFLEAALERTPEHGVGDSLRWLLRQAAQLYSAKDSPAGCAIMQGGGAGGSDDSQGASVAKEFRQQVEKALHLLFRGKHPDEQLAAPPKVLAKFVLGTMRGLAQLACDGASRGELIKVADHAAASCVLPAH